MSDFKAKMHQIRFPLGLRPRPPLGELTAPPDPLAVFKGPTSKGRERKGGGKGKGRGGEGLEGPPISCWHGAPRRVNPALRDGIRIADGGSPVGCICRRSRSMDQQTEIKRRQDLAD